ncbi:hypothetical protein [Rhizobium sp. SG741]|uniref:hypothetical protein n=1 Tax=Rhizobium sp. SG741 TaxID=2587114 RepID=UPI0014475358|nr:hypothetical protein [Rhizobium sp. SG741]NKJ03854.1 hypothetical protein [Rhizobium sp. SG741]
MPEPLRAKESGKSFSTTSKQSFQREKTPARCSAKGFEAKSFDRSDHRPVMLFREQS